MVMSSQTAEVVEVLGGARVLGAARTAIEMAERVRAGFPFEAFEAMVEALSVSQATLAKVLMIQPRTLTRRKKAGHFAAEESDRLYRVARVLAHAISVLGDGDRAAAWMLRRNRALGGQAPLAMLDTDAGVQEIHDALGRLEYGIFA